MRIRGRVWALVGIGVVVLALIAGLAFAERVVQEDAAAGFYDAPDPLPTGDPGEVIAVERILTAPAGANAWRVMYHSRDLNGDDIAVSGTVIAPAGPAPEGGRPIVSWAHPTTGAAARCAPSIGLAPLDLVEGLETLLRAGISEGNAVLDAARAAQSIDEAGAGDDLLLWGHS